MKKFNKSVLTLLFLFAFVGFANAQTTTIKANLLSPIVRTGSFFIEHAISEEASIQLGGLYTGASIDDTKLRGFAITPEFRYYLSESGQKLDGFYIAPFLRYQNLELTDDSEPGKATLQTFGGGVTIGRQWIFKDRISLDLFIGPKYGSSKFDLKDGATEEQFSIGGLDGFGIRGGIALGVAF